jgi:hypothetical protein
VSTVTVRDFSALAAHVPAWDRLAWDAPQQVATLLPSWVEAFLHHRLQKNESWFCSFAYIGKRLVGVLPIVVTPHPVLGPRWPRLRTPFDAYTPSGDIVLAPDQAPAAFQALLIEVTREMPSHLSLDLIAVRQNSPVWRALQDGSSGYFLHRGTCFLYSFLNVQGDPNRYFSSLGKMRRNLRVGRRYFEKHGTISVEIRRGAEADEAFLAEFLALEASGWKGSMGTAILKNHDLVTFYTSLVRSFAAQRRLEWHGIRVAGRLVAAQLAVRCGASLMLPKYAYDEAFAEGMPGHILMEEVIKDAFACPKLTELNPMSSSPQHRLLHMAQDQYVNLHLVRRTTLAMLFQLPHVATRSLYRDYVQPQLTPILKRTYHTLRDKAKVTPP